MGIGVGVSVGTRVSVGVGSEVEVSVGRGVSVDVDEGVGGVTLGVTVVPCGDDTGTGVARSAQAVVTNVSARAATKVCLESMPSL